MDVSGTLTTPVGQDVLCAWPAISRRCYTTVTADRPFKSTIHGEMIPLDKVRQLAYRARVLVPRWYTRPENREDCCLNQSMGTVRLATGAMDMRRRSKNLMDNGWLNS